MFVVFFPFPWFPELHQVFLVENLKDSIVSSGQKRFQISFVGKPNVNFTSFQAVPLFFWLVLHFPPDRFFFLGFSFARSIEPTTPFLMILWIFLCHASSKGNRRFYPTRRIRIPSTLHQCRHFHVAFVYRFSRQLRSSRNLWMKSSRAGLEARY